ncbi:MAG: 1-acyl-sn-glycerol-3-phosphate acyltransferase [Candidatus Latescibacterota bacterium]|nr:1-acyl-sn-glycerol-3-phosphate acyltransferase [Candidatus Latescibacterota bacterium]
MPEPPLPDFKLRRVKLLADMIYSVSSVLIRYHRIVAEGTENLPLEGPALLLPKHHAYRDILVEGVSLYRLTERYPTFVMKTGLWGILEHFGGVKVTRPKDIRRHKEKTARRAAIKAARAANLDLQNYLGGLYRNGEVVISHPEGMRCSGFLGELQKEIVEHLLHVQKDFGIRVPIIPIGIEYESYLRPFSKVFFRIGEPIYGEDILEISFLMQRLSDDLRRLSGISS